MQLSHPLLKLISPVLLWFGYSLTTLPAFSQPPISTSALDLEPPLSPTPAPEIAQSSPSPSSPLPDTRHPTPNTLASSPPPATSPLDLPPNLLNSSPLLQRWLKQTPNVLEDIRRDPSFRTRLRLGYSYFPSNDTSGWNVGLEDVFIGRSGLTLSADYQATFNSRREAWGTDLRYYLRPLGSYINVAPVLGYRYLQTSRYTTDGLNVGLRLLLVPSRTGAADISLTQSWVAPGTGEDVGLTTLSFGYALTSHLRLSTDIQKQNARQRKDSRVGIVLEWMF